jgi:twinkle protein
MAEILEFHGRSPVGASRPGLDSSNGATEAQRRVLTSEHLNGPTLPWRKTYDDVRLRDGEVSLWAGYPGHGKTTLISQVALGLLFQGYEVRFFSLEMPTPLLRQVMYYQLSGSERPTARWMEAADKWLEPMSFIHSDDLLKPGQLLDEIEGWVMGDTRRHVIVDNLSFLDMPTGRDEETAVRSFMRECKRIAENYSAHIHLLMHMRKGMNEARPGMMDIAGSRHYAGLAHNAFVCWRNKLKQEHAQMSPEQVDAMTDRERTKHDEILAGPDTLLIVEKQRMLTFAGKIALWLDKPSRQFCSGPDLKKRDYRIIPAQGGE